MGREEALVQMSTRYTRYEGSLLSQGRLAMLKPLLRAPLELCEGRVFAPIWMTGRRLARCTSGIASVEFALVVPVLSLFVFGIISVSSVLYVQNNMESAAREAARRMAVAEATYTGGNVACTAAPAQIVGSAEYIACTRLPGWGVFTVDVNEEVCTVADSGQHLDVTVVVSVDGTQAALSDIFGIFASRNLSAEMIMRKEEVCA